MTTPVSLYALVFANGKQYIGISQNPVVRFATHRQAAARGSHCAVHAAIRKHGIPEMHVLCIGSRSYIADLEVKAISAFRTRDKAYGYNQAPGGEMSPVAGIGHTEQSRAKMSVSQVVRAAREGGRVAHMTKIAQIAAAQRSSDEYRAVASESAKVRWQTYPMTPEQRQRASERSRGNKNCVGRVLSEETKAKIAKSLRGRKLTEEARAKMSTSQKEAWRQRRPRS